ncbi:MAG TPA: hypothetical protein VMA36_07235 [Candidatus Limnocylindria bacterium]|nr:hypothetical protein [Candidatus Limnocylindria bacterium]
MSPRRPGFSVVLILGAVVLLVSILVGQKVGDRVLLQTERRVPIAGANLTPVPETNPTPEPPIKNWRRQQVVSVATDPAFPDPRVTRPPTPRPKPTAAPTPQPTPTPGAPVPAGIYTSPPLPIPLVSHEPSEMETEPPPSPGPP